MKFAITGKLQQKVTAPLRHRPHVGYHPEVTLPGTARQGRYAARSTVQVNEEQPKRMVITPITHLFHIIQPRHLCNNSQQVTGSGDYTQSLDRQLY
jgi:hypothetical protein